MLPPRFLAKNIQSDVEFSFSDIGIWSAIAARIMDFPEIGEPIP